MRLTNVRRSIHDAFAIHLGGPQDNLGGGHAKFNSNRWLANAGIAGLVIRAVMVQPAHLRGTAIFLNAPDNTITMSDIAAMKSGIWWQFIKRNPGIMPREQGILVAHIDRLVMGYRCRVWDAASNTPHTAGIMFAGLEGADKLIDLANKLLDVLAEFDSKSQIPVQEVINAEKEADSAQADSSAA